VSFIGAESRSTVDNRLDRDTVDWAATTSLGGLRMRTRADEGTYASDESNYRPVCAAVVYDWPSDPNPKLYDLRRE
jgi:hypothetical protein